MKIAVLSGKGGTGKTLTAVNLAAAAEHGLYVDCDVEEPNGRLFLKPVLQKKSEVCTRLPEFDAAKCTGCRKCVDFCRFHALIYIREKPKVFPEVCHSCGGCMLVCKEQAVSETKKTVGYIEEGIYENTKVITGILNTGEASGVPVIEAALQAAENHQGVTVIDCPPGSACPVVESIKDADYCLFVAEPTAFGFHNFQMVYELAALLGKPCGVILNKTEGPYEPMEQFCREHKLPILLRLLYSRDIAEAVSKGELLVHKDSRYKQLFRELLTKTGGNAL